MNPSVNRLLNTTTVSQIIGVDVNSILPGTRPVTCTCPRCKEHAATLTTDPEYGVYVWHEACGFYGDGIHVVAAARSIPDHQALVELKTNGSLPDTVRDNDMFTYLSAYRQREAAEANWNSFALRHCSSPVSTNMCNAKGYPGLPGHLGLGMVSAVYPDWIPRGYRTGGVVVPMRQRPGLLDGLYKLGDCFIPLADGSRASVLGLAARLHPSVVVFGALAPAIRASTILHVAGLSDCYGVLGVRDNEFDLVPDYITDTQSLAYVPVGFREPTTDPNRTRRRFLYKELVTVMGSLLSVEDVVGLLP